MTNFGYATDGGRAAALIRFSPIDRFRGSVSPLVNGRADRRRQPRHHRSTVTSRLGSILNGPAAASMPARDGMDTLAALYECPSVVGFVGAGVRPG
jgi:hypothetical protein